MVELRRIIDHAVLRHSVDAGADIRFATLTVPQGAPLSEAAEQALDHAALPPRVVRAGTDLIREGERAERLYLVVEGWAFRYMTARDGARQISAVLVPGDVANIDALSGASAGSGIRAVTRLTVAALSCDSARALAAEHADIANLFLMRALGDNAMLSRWALCNGRLPAFQRLACLLCELSVRLDAIADNRSRFDLPLTQELLADVLGLTSVHVNRVLQGLRRDGVLMFGKRQIAILDLPLLHAIAGWQTQYADRAAADRRSMLPREGGPQPHATAITNSRGLS